MTEPPNEADPPAPAAEPPKEQEPVAEHVPLVADDLTFAEGFEVDEPIRDEFLAVLNDREKSPKEQAQALIDLQMKSAKAASETISKAWEDTNTAWRDEVKADSDVGGDKLQPALGRIGRLLDEYGSAELKQVLDLTGAGNNVHVIKLLDKVSQKLVEGDPVSGAPKNQEGDAASRMFPSMKG